MSVPLKQIRILTAMRSLHQFHPNSRSTKTCEGSLNSSHHPCQKLLTFARTESLAVHLDQATVDAVVVLHSAQRRVRPVIATAEERRLHHWAGLAILFLFLGTVAVVKHIIILSGAIVIGIFLILLKQLIAISVVVVVIVVIVSVAAVATAEASAAAIAAIAGTEIKAAAAATAITVSAD